jgi:hypothetical protein
MVATPAGIGIVAAPNAIIAGKRPAWAGTLMKAENDTVCEFSLQAIVRTFPTRVAVTDDGRPGIVPIS